MTRVQRLSINQLHFTTVPDQRVADVTAALDAQRANRRAATDPIDRENAERNISDLETVLERANANLQAHVKHMARLEAEHQAEREETERRALDAQVDQLRRGYLAMPGATEAGFQQALPRLLERQREDAALTGNTLFTQQVAEAKQRIGRMF